MCVAEARWAGAAPPAGEVAAAEVEAQESWRALFHSRVDAGDARGPPRLRAAHSPRRRTDRDAEFLALCAADGWARARDQAAAGASSSGAGPAFSLGLAARPTV